VVQMKAIHLCCGGGGTTLGFERAGIETAYAFDYWPPAVETHRLNWPDVRCEQRDIRALHAADLPQADVWTCGIPCEPFSVAGYRLEERDERDISAELARLLNEASAAGRGPAYVFLENVPQYRHSAGAEMIREALAGYGVFEAVLRHADWGVPQKRQRWHIIASRAGRVITPEATHSEQPDLFGRPGWVRFGEIGERDVAEPHYMSARALRGVIRRQRSKVLSGLARDASVFGVLYIVDDADLMPTVMATAHKGISRNQAVVVFDDYRFRQPTELELRRAQGLPDDFVLAGNKRERYEQIARAVAPPVAEAVGRAMIADAAAVGVIPPLPLP